MVMLGDAKYELKSKVSKQLQCPPHPSICFAWCCDFKEDSLVVAQLHKEMERFSSTPRTNT